MLWRGASDKSGRGGTGIRAWLRAMSQKWGESSNLSDRIGDCDLTSLRTNGKAIVLKDNVLLVRIQPSPPFENGEEA